jgi:hypothetical protein
MLNDLIYNFLGILVIIFGILDGIKYHWLAVKVRQLKTAKGQSRKFVNVALGKDLVLFAYLAFHPDWYLILMTFIGFIFTVELLLTVYKYYPYRNRGLHNFKKPSIWKYFINSLIPNDKRKRL